MREALGSPHIDSRPSRGPGRETLVRLAQPEISARVRDIDDADAILVVGTDPLHSRPILDLRIRKAIRRNGAKLAVAPKPRPRSTAAPTAVTRYAPAGRPPSSPSWPPLSPSRRKREAIARARRRDRADTPSRRRHLGRPHRSRGRRRHGRPARPRRHPQPRRATRLGPPRSPRLHQRPRPARGGLPPRRRSGTNRTAAGKDTQESASATPSNQASSKHCCCSAWTPSATSQIRKLGKRRWQPLITSSAFSTFETATTAMADVVFPLETPRRKTAPCRTQMDACSEYGQARPAPATFAPTGSPSRAFPCAGPRHGRFVPAICLRSSHRSRPVLRRHLGLRYRWAGYSLARDGGVCGARLAGRAIAQSVRRVGPPNSQILEDQRPGRRTLKREARPATPAHGSYPRTGICGPGPITELNPPLRFLAPQQRVELSLSDAGRLGLKTGDKVRVAQNGISFAHG